MTEQRFTKALDRLSRPFADRDVEWVPNWTWGDSYDELIIGVAPYIRRESIYTRLNVVCGEHNWKTEIVKLGDVGLFLSILLRREGEWVGPKWEGATMSGGDGGPDRVKGVISRSVRRAGEPWGLGLYLQFMPDMFAVKRPSDYYDSDEKTRVKLGNTKQQVRWDHPQIPKEFLPDYMTPEQFVRLRRLLTYFPEDKKEGVQQMIDSWAEDPDSVTYQDAEMTITAAAGRVQKRLSSINKQQVSLPNTSSNNREKSAPRKNRGQNTEDQGQPRQQAPSESTSQGPQKGYIGRPRLKELMQATEDLKKVDPSDGALFDPDWLKNIRAKCKEHAESYDVITEQQCAEWMQQLSDKMDMVDDDLPF